MGVSKIKLYPCKEAKILLNLDLVSAKKIGKRLNPLEII